MLGKLIPKHAKIVGGSGAEKQISRIVFCLSYFTVPLAIGSHVVAECFRIFPVPAKETESMLNKIADYCSEIAVDENGSKLLQILLSEHYIIGSCVAEIAQTVISNYYYWSQDRFGSSVIQHLIGLEKPNLLQDLVHAIQGIFIDLCYNKYGRDVIKKLIGASKKKYASQIISEIINDRGLVAALVDPDGYSFLKSIKNYAKGTDLKILNVLIRQYAQPLKKQ
ncbi:pumilio homolog 12-like [Henckelia pumila]|uniref:pumilio homolog 12-like n=1 Tax=Henckelia pumila TaxID=405737 RepID=UPI003C6E4B33